LKFTPFHSGNIHSFLGKIVYATGLATCAMGFQDMQGSDLSSSMPPMNDTQMAMMNMTMGDDMGYSPTSTLAQSACACVLLITFCGIATFAALNWKVEKKEIEEGEE